MFGSQISSVVLTDIGLATNN